jgi:integrase
MPVPSYNGGAAFCYDSLIRINPIMPKNYQMTWIPDSRRWTKFHRGKRYFVSCRQLDVPETKEASWRAANEWWERRKGIASLPAEDDRVERATRISHLVRDFSKLDDDTRREAVEALLGVGSYDSLKSQAGTMLAGMDTPSPERTVKAQIESWKTLLRGVCQSGQMSEGRFDAYCRNIRAFVDWIGPETAIDAIDETKLEGFFNHLSAKVGVEEYSPTYAHTLLMTAKQFVSRLAEMKLIALPGNIRSRRFRFNHSVAAKIEIFTIAEVRQLLDISERFSERTHLFILLMLNCGMYQNDIAELKTDEVNWKAGTLTRARSKTRERGGPVITYKLWPETFTLLKKHRAAGELALTTEEGNPLVKYWLENGVMRRYDAIQSAWSRVAGKMGGKIRLGMKHLRKTSATILGQHPHFKFYANHFLADSPKSIADKHYVVASDVEFFEALDWLCGQIMPEGR